LRHARFFTERVLSTASHKATLSSGLGRECFYRRDALPTNRKTLFRYQRTLLAFYHLFGRSQFSA
jgi:hypothetical protein